MGIYDYDSLHIPEKPVYDMVRFRHRGKIIGEYTTIEPAYNCPCCNLTVWGLDKAETCSHCGKKLDWSNVDVDSDRMRG